jgi:hypothetical protein
MGYNRQQEAIGSISHPEGGAGQQRGKGLKAMEQNSATQIMERGYA